MGRLDKIKSTPCESLLFPPSNYFWKLLYCGTLPFYFNLCISTTIFLAVPYPR